MSASAKNRKDNIPLAVLTIVFTVFALATGDALIKSISADLVLWQIFVIRSTIALPVLVLTIKLLVKGTSLRPVSLFWTIVRSLMLTLMWVVYYAALPHVDLSIAAAAYYTLPIFIALFESFFIGEKINRVGWFAVFLGFFGIVLILKPNAADFNFFTLLPIISAILYALSMLLTRTKCVDENPFVLSLALNITFIVVGTSATALLYIYGKYDTTNEAYSFLTGQWAAMGQTEWTAMMVLAVTIIIGSVGTAIAYQSGPPSVVGTFDFAYVAFAAMWGFLIFSETMDAVTLIGIGFIVVSGILAIRS